MPAKRFLGRFPEISQKHQDSIRDNHIIKTNTKWDINLFLKFIETSKQRQTSGSAWRITTHSQAPHGRTQNLGHTDVPPGGTFMPARRFLGENPEFSWKQRQKEKELMHLYKTLHN